MRAETIIWKDMENRSPSRRWVEVDFFNQIPRFRIGTCLEGGLGVALKMLLLLFVSLCI
jgi:hypothetical protein